MCSAPRPLPTLRGTLLAVGIALALLLSASAASLSALFFRLGVTDISLVRRGSSRCDALLLLDLCQDFGHGSSRIYAATGSSSAAGFVRSKKASMAFAGIW